MQHGFIVGQARREQRRTGVKPGHVQAARQIYQRYLNELSAYPLLEPEEELALARTIEEHELALWQVLLATPGALDVVNATLATHVALPAAWAGFVEAVRVGTLTPAALREMAEVLRDLDETRAAKQALEQAIVCWSREAPDRAAVRAEVERVQRGYRLAADRMVTANLRLVLSLARRYGAPRLLSAEDFVQEGNLGLLRAVERYDHRRGVRFGTYAAWWIRHAFNRALSDRGRLVRVPVHTLDDASRLARVSNALWTRDGVAPTVEVLVAETGIPLDRVTALVEQGPGREPVSLDREVGERGQSTMLDGLAAENEDVGVQLDALAWGERVRPLLERLTAMEADILRFRFGLEDREELTLRELGDKYGLTRERIRQVQEKALGKLRRALSELARGEAADWPLRASSERAAG